MLYFVYYTIYRGPKSTVIVKQALPYVRCVGESWPLSLQRAHYENEALQVQYKHCQQHTPQVSIISICSIII
jgi:5-methylthioribose kinase